MKTLSRLLAVLLLGAMSTVGWAAKVDNISIVKQDKYYVTNAQFLIDVPRANVFDAFTQFDRLSAINSAVIDSSVEEVSEDTTRVTTRVRDCVGLFCKTLTLVEDVTVLNEGTIRSTMVHELGDFKDGNTLWEFESLGQQTKVRYHSRVRPGFWLPPLIGKRAMRKVLTRQIIAAVNNLEAISSE